MQTLIIIPCFNEASRLDLSAFEFFGRRRRNYHFLFVNDGSSDDTANVLKKFVAENQGNFACLHLKNNVGKAEAIRQGMLQGLKNSAYEFYGYLDADLATPLDQLDLFAEQIERKNLDMIFGSRILRLGTRIKRKAARHYIGRIFATIASMILGIAVYDTQCGAKILSSPLAKKVFATPFITKWLFDVEIFFRLKPIEQLNIYEFAVDTWVDVDGSKLRIKDFIQAPLDLIKIYKHYKAPKENFAKDSLQRRI